ncbi:hypothetical protein CASFOL_040687 [Castilleja foliolosa]|uniref:Uncharacterized protein n=1 Tax=Castilleja foliolosa TaxID=1961234 RepID=A0ABD3BD54_9LAMI
MKNSIASIHHASLTNFRDKNCWYKWRKILNKNNRHSSNLEAHHFLFGNWERIDVDTWPDYPKDANTRPDWAKSYFKRFLRSSHLTISWVKDLYRLIYYSLRFTV